MLPKVGLIYVPFKNTRHFADVVASWQALTYPKDRLTIYIVPNSDPEGMMPEVERVAREAAALGLPRVKVLADGINHGFAGNHNKGIRAALEDGCEYVYLNNGDLKLDARAIDVAVKVVEEDPSAAAVQSLMLYWHQPDTVNVLGGVFHVAGYGYAGGNLIKRNELSARQVQEIGYASAGAALYRASALREVGLLEEGFFMYHEDLELGLRLRASGYVNLVAVDSIAYHDYKFATNAGLFEWTEQYRYVVTFAYWRPLTLLLIAPILLGVELATWVFALRGGWLGPKVRAACGLLKPRTWKLIVAMRMRMKRLRKVGDHALFAYVSGRIEAQEQSNWIVERFANPFLAGYVAVLRKIIVW